MLLFYFLSVTGNSSMILDTVLLMASSGFCGFLSNWAFAVPSQIIFLVLASTTSITNDPSLYSYVLTVVFADAGARQ